MGVGGGNPKIEVWQNHIFSKKTTNEWDGTEFFEKIVTNIAPLHEHSMFMTVPTLKFPSIPVTSNLILSWPYVFPTSSTPTPKKPILTNYYYFTVHHTQIDCTTSFWKRFFLIHRYFRGIFGFTLLFSSLASSSSICSWTFTRTSNKVFERSRST